ncbi:S-adenosyl-L-methionine-dependent methyltransferase [Agrocybe pediades]|nr:S-adenosyl-L-methionine-dependent methyltransferase [Agrocybe pediades]
MSTAQTVQLPFLDLDDPALKPKVDYTPTEVHHEHSAGHSHAHHGHGASDTHQAHTAAAVDYVEENKKHFNKVADHNHDDPRWVLLGKRSAAEIIKRYPFDKDATLVLDFASNAGLVARELLPHSKQIIGVDISDRAIAVFNDWVSKQGISSEKMRGIAVELKGEEGELDGMKFDVITCTASYHHFEDINKMTKLLAFFLKPGGVLLITDMLKQEEKAVIPGKAFDHIVPHRHGLSEEGLKDAFEGAGLTTFALDHFSRVKIMDMESILFVASGKKPAAV